MTCIALHRCRDVLGRLARTLGIIVAGGTTATRLLVIKSAGWIPGGLGVAGPTALAAQYVVGGLRSRTDPRARRVTGKAIARRSFENRIDVAGLTGLHSVRADEFETRCQVIELRSGSLRERVGAQHLEQ